MRRSPDKYDVIQASLVDTWAATAAGAYTLTENTLYTVEAFNDYLDHLTDDGRADDHAVGVRRPAAGVARAGGVRAARLGRRPAPRHRPARPRRDVPAEEIAVHRRRGRAARRRSPSGCSSASCMRRAATAPIAPPADEWVDGDSNRGDYARSHQRARSATFYASYPQDIRPTTDDRPFFFHTTKLEDQFHVAFGRSMLFGNGLSALLTLMGISAALVAAVRHRSAGGGRRRAVPQGGSSGWCTSARWAPASC